MKVIPNLVMLIGLPGSGKSYLANEYQCYGYKIHSSDAIREELSGDINNQEINERVFKVLHSRIKYDLSNGNSCVYDATNISYKKRRTFLAEIKNIPCYKIAIVIATPYEVCLCQNAERDRKVPENVIDRMYKNFDIPYYYEGWDKIELFYGRESYKEAYGEWSQFIFDTLTYDQENKYHSETLGEHCRECMEYILKHSTKKNDKQSVIIAGALHDCGKPYCKTFKDSKGNKSENAHYYNHEHVGSYNSLFYNSDRDEDSRLYTSILIRWHMQMHFIDKQPHTQNKYENLFGETLWNDLCILHTADKDAH